MELRQGLSRVSTFSLGFGPDLQPLRLKRSCAGMSGSRVVRQSYTIAAMIKIDPAVVRTTVIRHVPGCWSVSDTEKCQYATLRVSWPGKAKQETQCSREEQAETNEVE